jgi:hypothetical protein
MLQQVGCTGGALLYMDKGGRVRSGGEKSEKNDKTV